MFAHALEFCISESGAILWVGAGDLDGIPPAEFNLWDATTLENDTAMVMELYQDDGFLVKVVLGALTERENAEWTARACRRINAAGGRLLISSVFSDPENFASEYAAFEPAEQGSCHGIGAIVAVPPGIYTVEVYSYPPGDLSAAWEAIVDPDNYRIGGGLEHPEIVSEHELDYFHRTRPGEEPPTWINDGDDETSYVNFIVRLLPAESAASQYSEISAEGFVVWEFRKPQRFPLGIPSAMTWPD